MDKGFLFNLKNLTLKPQQFISNYIHGKRKGVFNPVSFLVISITIYLIGESLVDLPVTKSTTIESHVYSVGKAVGKASRDFLRSYFKYFWILSILWLGLSTRLVFKKYNYAEHVAISSFIVGQATLAGLIGFLIFKFPLFLNPFMYLVILSMVFQVFKKEDKSKSFFKSLVTLLLFFIQLIFIILVIGIIRM